MFHSMRGKVLAAIIGVTVFAGLLITVLFYWKSSDMIEENYKENLYARIHQMGDAFDSSLREIYQLTTLAACDEELLKKTEAYLDSEDEFELEEISEQLRAYSKRCTDLTSVYLVLPNKSMIVTSKDYPIYRRQIDPDVMEAIKTISEDALTPAMIRNPVGRTSDILSFVSSIENSHGDTIAYIMSNIEERALYYKYLDSLEDGKTLRTMILDQDSAVVSTKNNRDIGTIYRNNEKDNKVIRATYRTEFTGYSFFLETEKDKVLADLKEFRYFLAVILLIVFCVALIPTVFITQAMYQPLKNLTRTMELVSEGELDQRVEVTTKDEIGTLSHNFNHMLEHIQNLIDQLVKEEILKKDAELEALQYQITPHFMYNTLNSIKYAALLKGEEKIGGMIESFVELLQASINKKGIFVTVAEELHFIENYMVLQNMRYEDKIVISYEVQSEAEGCFLPRLMLQPLVENAILHGMDIKTGNSHITIRGTIEHNMLYLAVEDNGRGMSDGQIEELLKIKEKKTRGMSGIGVVNVLERLKLYYGTDGGIMYESSENGTKACIYLPAYKEQNQYAL